MELRRDRSLSAVHERSQINQPITPLLGERANPTDAAKLGLGHSFDNSRQASIEISASFISNNAEASSQVNNTEFYNQPHFSTQFQFDDSNLVSSGNFQPQLNEEDLTSYSQMQHNCEWNSLRHSSRTLSPNDLPACLDIGNSNSIFDMDKIQSNDSFHIGQLNMISQNQDKIPSNYLQPTFPFPAYQSPNFNPFHLQPSPGSSRHNSLGAGSDNIFHGGSPHDLNLMQSQFQGHRRSPSVYSDVSTPSVQHSPNIGIHDLSDRFHSPKLTPKDSSMIHDFLDIEYFSLSDPQAQNVHSSRSPDYSSENSQQSEPQQNNILGSYDGDSHEGFVHREQIFSQESFPSLNKDLGLPHQMIPPEINVEFAPTRRQTSIDPPKPSLINQDALTLPEKARRPRAFTDTTNANSTRAPRALLPFSNYPRRESSLSQTGFSHPNHSLSPHSDLGATPPSRPRGRSTPSTPNRKYILSPVASENKATVPDNGSSKRPQKYPAIAQCNLCPKRFTRAYNLRSHLRTHTDERPFACSICKRAFARQHDRKRHESLHSGEKKFICKGKLKPTGEWGCGKPFARADALGRHFRSEAGRVCINPLLEEETRERQQAWNEQQIQNEQQTQNMYNMQQPMQIDSNGFSGNFMLPAALLAQYPALATLSWSGLSQADVSKEDDLSWANTFDASGSEYYDDGDEGGYISSGPTSQQHV